MSCSVVTCVLSTLHDFEIVILSETVFIGYFIECTGEILVVVWVYKCELHVNLLKNE